MKRRKQPNLIILAEDSNTSRLAEGFIQHYSVNEHRCRIHKYARGWKDAAELAATLKLDRNTDDYVVLIIDFDLDDPRMDVEVGVDRRIAKIKSLVAGNIRSDRLFVLGSRSESEPFKEAMHRYFSDRTLSFEEIGWKLADECAGRIRFGAWCEDELVHNMESIEKLERIVKPFLFR